MRDAHNAAELELTPEFLRFEPPRLSKTLLAEAAERLFGVTGALTPLEGERDQNHRLRTAEGEEYVLKVAGATEDPGVVDFQIKALQRLEELAPDLPAPRVVPTLTGAATGQVTDEADVRYEVRLLTYLPGIPHSDGRAPSIEGLREIGRFGGRLAAALAGFEHPSARHFMPWDLNNGLLCDAQLWARGEADVARLESDLRPSFEDLFTRRLKPLRAQVAHFDLHRDNLLRADAQSESVVGVIDFGDMHWGPLVCDVAILAASFSSNDDPLESMAAAVAGYHQALPLQDEEISVIYDLALARLAQTVLLTDFRIKATEHPPDFIREMRPELMAGLEALLRLDGREATARFAAACGRDL